jgi:hypothetical protein
VSNDVAATSRRARALVGEVATVMSAKVDQASDALTDAIHENVTLADDLYPSTRLSTRSNLSQITSLVLDGSQPCDLTAPPEALAYARGYVREGLSMDCLTRVYRQGQRTYTRLWLEELQSRAPDAPVLADAMGYVSDWLFGYVEEIDKPLSEVYTAEHERWIRGGVAVRAEEVRAILAGNAHVDVTEASSRLRYRLDGRHIGFVIWDDLSDGEVSIGNGLFEDMDRFAGEVAEALGGTSMLALPMGRQYVGWATVAPKEGVAEELPPGRPGLHVATGRPGRGIDGFRRSHEEALLARRVATLGDQSRYTSFETCALDALLTQDIEEARRFVRHELGPLMDSDAHRRLVSTLEVFLHEESSYVRAARRLGVHENTVAYRVKKAEELLGRKTSEQPLELRAALRLYHFVRDGRG